MKKYPKLLFFACLMLITSCSYSIYTPSASGTYTVHEKDQLLVSGGIDIPDVTDINLALNASYSPFTHFGTQFNVERSFNNRKIGLSLGYYQAKYKIKKAKKIGYHFDVYMGYSLNKSVGSPTAFSKSIKFNYQDLSLSTGFHCFWRFVGIDIIYKPHLIINTRKVEYYPNLTSNFFISDLTSKISLGKEELQLFLAMNLALSKSQYQVSFDQVTLSTGLNINIGEI